MTSQPSPARLLDLVHELRGLPHETEWLAFTVSYDDPQSIGEYISALSNAAALSGKNHAYMLWGIEDGTHEIVGTRFSPAKAKKGNEPIESWLFRFLDPAVAFDFHEVVVEGKRVVLLRIARAFHRPIAFDRLRYVRVGSTKRRLDHHPEKERVLWRLFDRIDFEEQVAAARLSATDVLSALDYPSHFNMLGQPPPDGKEAIAAALVQDALVAQNEAGGFDVTNLGAILLARNLGDFPRMRRKALRVVHYKGTSRLQALTEQEVVQGYASGFDKMAAHVVARLPATEKLDGVFRRSVTAFPEVAVRELIANALVHQDFAERGTGPMVEIFEGRLEICNPGAPLVDTRRFVDASPKSRNEAVASLMRRYGFCEERGTGIDKVLSEIEQRQLPAPLFEAESRSTRVVLFDRKTLAQMDRHEKLRACYLHACLQFVNRSQTTNGSLRERLGVPSKNASVVSRVLGEAVDTGLIVVANPENGLRARHYLPFWAVSDDSEAPDRE